MLNSGTGEGESRHRRNNKVDWRYFLIVVGLEHSGVFFYVVKLDCVIKREKKFYDSSKKRLLRKNESYLSKKNYRKKSNKKVHLALLMIIKITF